MSPVVHVAATQWRRGRHKKKSLMDPKNFDLKYLDGDKETKNAVDEWRDDMEEYFILLS